jgi:hypothetical protein
VKCSSVGVVDVILGYYVAIIYVTCGLGIKGIFLCVN